jgi:hypothetical protein
MARFIKIFIVVIIVVGASVVAMVLMSRTNVRPDKQTQLDNKVKCYEAATKKFEEIKRDNPFDPLNLSKENIYLNEGYAFSDKYNTCFLKYGSFTKEDPANLFELIVNVYTGENVALHTPGKNLKSFTIETNNKFNTLSLEIFGK